MLVRLHQLLVCGIHNMKRNITNKPGYVLLLSILIVGAVGIAITTTVLLLGISTQQTSLAYQRAGQARALADSCAEEALMQIRDSAPFTGTGSLTFGQGSCEYGVINTGGSTRLVNSTSTVSTAIRKTKVTATTVNPQITIFTWQEVSDL